MPPYFQWIIDKRLAICAHPFHASHIRYFLEQRIHTVISVGSTYSTDIPNKSRADLHVENVYVPEGGAPTNDDCRRFVQRMNYAQQRGEVRVFFFFSTKTKPKLSIETLIFRLALSCSRLGYCR